MDKSIQIDLTTIFCLFWYKNLIFLFNTPTSQKTSTSVYLFYNLFYLNNQFSHFFIISLNYSFNISKCARVHTQTLSLSLSL